MGNGGSSKISQLQWRVTTTKNMLRSIFQIDNIDVLMLTQLYSTDGPLDRPYEIDVSGQHNGFSVNNNQLNTSFNIPSGKLRDLWQITVFTGKTHYFYCHVQELF